jgi:hypothetical protein
MATPERIRNAGPQYLTLQKTLTESKWAVTELPIITQRVQNIEQRYKATQDNIAKFDKRSEKQHDRLGKLTHNSVKRAWFKTTGKLEEKIKEEEKEFMKQYELTQAAKAKGIEQESELNDARQFKQQCQDAKQKYDAAKKDLDALMEELFAGPTPAYPTEDVIEQNLVAKRQKLGDLTILSKRQTYILNALRKADACLLAGLQSLQSALQVNTIDMFTRSDFATMMAHSALAEARDLAARAQFIIQEVRRLDPNVPHLGDIHVEQDAFIFNMMFNNIFTDLRVQQIIQTSSAKLQTAAGIMEQQVLPVTLSLASAADANVKNCTKEVMRLENDMWRERVRIVSEVIGVDMPQSSVDAGVRATTPLPPPPPPPEEDDDLASDEAPPPYTALSKSEVRS